MKDILRDIKVSILATIVFAAVLCGLYPLVIWGIGQAVFPSQANGNLVMNKQGDIVGSRLIGQQFSAEKYFHPRPSAAGSGYDSSTSGGTNLGPTSQKLADAIKANIAAYRKENNIGATTSIPADAVEASASGLDPHISLENATLQAPRIAKARKIDLLTVQDLISANTDQRGWGFLGEPGVNVLSLNIALDTHQGAQ